MPISANKKAKISQVWLYKIKMSQNCKAQNIVAFAIKCIEK